MIVCLSPNGRNQSQSDGPATKMLVATVRGICTLERSTPDSPWQVTGRSLEESHISAILYEPRSGLLFAGVHGSGLYASSDEGTTWEERTNGLTSTHVFTLAAQERDGQTVLFAGCEPASLHRSFDFGMTWEELPSLRGVPGTDAWTFPPPPHIAHVKNLAFDPRDPATFYACVEQGALLKTTDDGRTWQEIDTYEGPDELYRHDCHRLVLNRQDPDRMFMATGEGLYRTVDGGEHWDHLITREGRLGYPDGLFLDPRDLQTVYVSGGERAPGTWRDGYSNATVLRSRDGGETFEEIHSGLPERLTGNIEALSLHEWPGNIALYAGTATGEVYANEGGEDWQLIASGLAPVSKVGHYRMFLPKDERRAVEAAMGQTTD